MSLTKLTANLNKVGSLPDKPTLQSDELKAVFDQAANEIKNYINEVLLSELEKTKTITLSGAVSGSSNFAIGENIIINTSIIKPIVDYLYLITYTNNTLLVSSVKSLAGMCADMYLTGAADNPSTTQAYYWQQMDSYCVNLVRYLVTILPSNNTYRTLLNNWISNYQLTTEEMQTIADMFTAQEIALLVNAGSSSQSTFKIEDTNYSLPNIILKLKNSL